MKSELEKLKREIASIRSNHTGSVTKLRYPQKIKDTTLRIFKSQSELSASGFANEIGVSGTAISDWLYLSQPRAKETKPEMIPVKVQGSLDPHRPQKSVVLSSSRVTIIVIEGDESGVQLDRIFRGLKITDQLAGG